MAKFDKLPETKKKNGYLYRMVTRSKNAAIYSQQNQKIPEDTSVGYEVFEIEVCKPYSLVQKHGKKKGEVYHYPAAEKFPSNEDAGKSLWCYSTLESAMAKFEELSNK